MSLQFGFRRDQSGNIGIIFGIALVPLSIAAGSALDYSRAASARTWLQAMVDGAALAGAAAQDTKVATNFFNGQSFSDLKDAPTVTAQLVNNKMVVSAAASIKTSVLGVIHVRAIPIAVNSTAAAAQPGPPVCVLALNRSANNAVSFSGNTSFIAQNCGIYSDSASSSAISSNGSILVKTGASCAVGGYSGSGFDPPPKTNCPVIPDPFANIPGTQASVTCQSISSVKPSESKTLSPGTYCSGLDIKGTANLNPGLYVITGGQLSINSGANVAGNGVTFYLTGPSAGFTLNGGGNINISAMTTGDYAGVLIMQDRGSNMGASNALNGNSTTLLKGAIYTPTQKLNVTGSGAFGQSNVFMPMIADTLAFSGTSTVQSDVNSVTTGKPLATFAQGPALTN